MKNILTGVLALGITSQIVAKPWVQPELQDLFTSKKATEVSVIAKFRSTNLKSKSAETPSQIIRRKQREAAISQKDLLAELETKLQKKSDVKSIKKFWIDNSMVITASTEYIQKLAQRDDLVKLELNEKIKLFDPMEVSDENVDSDSLTYGLKKVRAKEIWDNLGMTGAGVTVGILDTGVDSSHPDLEGRVIAAKDFVSNYDDNTPNDGHGHGTHCAGTIGGKATSGKAIGVAPDVKFINAKIFSDSGSTSREAILEGMQWMTDPDGNPDTDDFPRVVSNSWGGPLGTHWVEIMNTWHSMGMAPVFAAGNSGPRPGTVGAPGAYKEAITIGATDSQDNIARFSSRGPVTFQGETYIKPDVSAPGVDVYSAKNGGGYQMMSGTSMATPHVAGVVALMLQADPDLPVERIREILHETSVDLGEPGMDNVFGMGRVDAFEAVQLVLTGGKVSATIGSGDQDATIKVSPGNKTFKTRNGVAKLSLAAGTYELQVSAFGYFSATTTVEVKAKETTEISLDLEQAPTFTATFNVANAAGTSLNASVAFQGVPVEGGNTDGGSLAVDLPGGSYTVQVQSRGYQSKMVDINVTGNTTFDIAMDALPPYVLVDDDKGKDYEKYFKAALDAAGAEYDVADKTLSPDDLMGYANVVWFVGADSSNTFSADEQAALTEYVNSGGRLIVSGQDIGYDIKNDAFYADVLGAKYLKDTSKVKTISGSGVEFSLDGGDSANNQKYPDVIEAVGNATALFSYTGQGPAALVNSYGAGKAAYTAFGFEGVNGADARNAVMAVLLDAVKPGSEDLLNRIEWAFENNRELYYVLINNFKVTEENKSEVANILENKDSKAAFRSVLGDLKQLQ